MDKWSCAGPSLYMFVSNFEIKCEYLVYPSIAGQDNALYITTVLRLPCGTRSLNSTSRQTRRTKPGVLGTRDSSLNTSGKRPWVLGVREHVGQRVVGLTQENVYNKTIGLLKHYLFIICFWPLLERRRAQCRDRSSRLCAS